MLMLRLIEACWKCLKKTSEEHFRNSFSISLVIQRQKITNITQPYRHELVLGEDGGLNGPCCQKMEPYKDENET